MSARLLFSMLPALTAFLLFAETAQAAGGVDHGFEWSWFNFLLLLLVLGYFARKSLPTLMLGRRAEVKADIDKATNLLAEAEARLAEWQRKIDALDQEAAELRSASLRIAESEKEHILKQARKTAERIRHEAKVAVAREVENARAELRAEAANLTIECAQEILSRNITDSDRGRLLDGFIENVEQASPSPGEARD